MTISITWLTVKTVNNVSSVLCKYSTLCVQCKNKICSTVYTSWKWIGCDLHNCEAEDISGNLFY